MFPDEKDRHFNLLNSFRDQLQEEKMKMETLVARCKYRPTAGRKQTITRPVKDLPDGQRDKEARQSLQEPLVRNYSPS